MVRPTTPSKDALGVMSSGITKFSSKSQLPSHLSSLAKENRPHGTPHVKNCSLKGPWIFNDSGRFAATLVNDRKYDRLKIVIYDCLEKKAFDYMNEMIKITPNWFYWFGDMLVLIEPKDHPNPSLSYFCFEMNHSARNVRLTHYKRRDHNSYIPPKIDQNVYQLRPILLGNIVYMPVYSRGGGSSLFLIPSNPFSNLPFKEYHTVYPGQEDRRTMYKRVTVPISDGKYIYLLRTNAQESLQFRLDSMLQVDLSKLQDVYNIADTEIQDTDLSAYSEIRFQSTNSREFPSFDAKSVPQISYAYDGTQFILNFKRDGSFTECLFEVTTRTMALKSGRDSDAVLASFHPLGGTVQISYGNDRKLSCKEAKSLLPKQTVPSLMDITRRKILFGNYVDDLLKNPRLVKNFF